MRFEDPIVVDPYSDYVFVLRKDGKSFGTLKTGNPDAAKFLLRSYGSGQATEEGVTVEYLGDLLRVRIEEPEDFPEVILTALSRSGRR